MPGRRRATDFFVVGGALHEAEVPAAKVLALEPDSPSGQLRLNAFAGARRPGWRGGGGEGQGGARDADDRRANLLLLQQLLSY